MTKAVHAGSVIIGGGAPVSVQSMTNTDTSDFDSTYAQVYDLKCAGCDIVRLAVRSDADISACRKLIQRADIPLVADIQFDYKLAVKSADAGFNKIRINPGNIGGRDKVAEVAAACKRNGAAIRVGVNSGSIDKALARQYGYTATALGESALRSARLLEDCGFYDIVLSAKASDVRMNVEAYRYLSSRCDYPLHIGVTESGTVKSGLIKSAVGLGALLLDGIGDTLRVSLAGDPVEEVYAGRAILRASGQDDGFVEVIACPTCARCAYDVAGIAGTVERATAHIKKRIKVAVMGCAVNGPGEAGHADIGICGAGDGRVAVFMRGEIIDKIPQEEAVATLLRFIDEYGKQ